MPPKLRTTFDEATPSFFHHVRVFKYRTHHTAPSFFESDRLPGVYHESIEHWMGTTEKPVQLHISSPHVGNPFPMHGAYMTGRRLELFDHVSPEWLEDMGLTEPLPGMVHLVDTYDLSVYRFRLV